MDEELKNFLVSVYHLVVETEGVYGHYLEDEKDEKVEWEVASPNLKGNLEAFIWGASLDKIEDGTQ